MSFLKNIIDEIENPKTNFQTIEHTPNHLEKLYMESQIALLKAQLMKLQYEAQVILNDDTRSVSSKEVKLTKVIKKTKYLLMEVIEYILNSPLKSQEFILQQSNDGITLQGQLGGLLYYFAYQYGIDIQAISQKLRENHQYTAIIDSNMSLEQFLHTFDMYYYRAANNDKLL